MEYDNHMLPLIGVPYSYYFINLGLRTVSCWLYEKPNNCLASDVLCAYRV